MSLTAAASGFVVFILSVQVIQAQDGWRVIYTSAKICALKGSTVEMSCTLTYPSRINDRDTTVQENFWFTKLNRYEPVDLRTDSEYSDRVQYYCKGNICTLRIKDLRESDSAVYKFRFMTNQPRGSYTGWTGVTLSVTDLQVKPSKYSYWADLTCQSRCNLPDLSSYVWYKNGEKIQAQTSSSYSDKFGPADSYSCAVEGYERFPSPSVCVHGRTCTKVTYDDKSICATKGSSVDISCTYNQYGYVNIKSKFWFSPERSHQWLNPSQPEDISEDSQYAGRVQVLETRRGRSTLRISGLTESDSAEYRFKFRIGSFEWRSSLPGTTLTVTALQVQVNRVTVHQYYTEAELKCHSSCSSAGRLSYVWFKNEQKVTWVKTSSYESLFYPGDIISCALKGQEAYRSPSVYAPNLPSVLASPSADIMEGSSVTLTCSSDANPAANYSWYKDNGDPDLHPLSKEPQLVFSSIQSSDSGQYYCEAENKLGRTTSGYISINVKYAPKTSSVSASPSGKVIEGSSVTLTCSSDANPAAKYTWYKDNQTLPHREDDIHYFTFIRSEDRGNYFCKSENQHGEIKSSSQFIDVQYAPKPLSVSVSSAEIVEGSSVTLTCSSDANPAASYTWYRKNQTLIQGPEGIYRFISISVEDSGYYHCESENKYGRINSTSVHVDVQYAPKLPSVSVSPSADIMEGSSVTLTCSSDANPAANYSWYKDNGDPDLHPLSKEPQLIFSSIQSCDSGQYYCEAENKLGRTTSGYISINVKYAPKTSSVSASPSGKVIEGSSVTLTCSSDANPAAKYTWYKDNQTLPHREDDIHYFTFIRSEDRGNYFCKSENQHGEIKSSSQFIDVQYAPKPPSVSVSPAEIVEGSSVTLTCSSDANPAASYTWYRKNQTLIQGPEGIYRFISISVEDSGYYHCESENKYGRINSTSVHVDVQYAPKLPSVSVSPSADIMEGSSVTLTCSSDANPAANYSWYKDNGDPDLHPLSKEPQLIFSSIQSCDSGQYYCEAENKLGRTTSGYISINVKCSMKAAAGGSITAIILAIIFLSALILIRRKRSSKQTAERPVNQAQLNMGSVCDNPSAATQRQQEQDNLCYASVRFSKNQEDRLYYNIRPAQSNRHEKKEEDEEDEDENDVEYSVVYIKSASASPDHRSKCQEDTVEEDSSTLYSTVTKKPRV